MAGYALHQCALYATRSRARLALRLGRSAGFLRARAGQPNLYRVWEEKKSSGGTRLIEAPREDLKAIQRRIADLLQRVLPPEYLYSPVKGRSYIENAIAHRGSTSVRLLDISNYFGNCSADAVYRFFREQLRCEPDVAWLLTGLTTRGGHLPQGSPCSPILSFYSCWPMWEKIAGLTREAGCVLTVYVDDITISGKSVPEELVWRIKQVLRGHGHSHARKKERRHQNRAAEITGIMVAKDRVAVPHRHYKKMQHARLSARLADDEQERSALTARARSLEGQIQRLKNLTS
jgi:retron-type reverse transcriptase